MHRTLVAWHHAGWQAVSETQAGSEEDAPVWSEEERNMALVRRFMEAQTNADLDTIDELLAPDFVDHSSFANQEPGREGYKQQVAEQIAALSEVRCVIEDQLAKDDKVVTRITWRSIHDRGEYFGLMPRGTEVEVTSMAMHRIVRGKITEEWSEGSGSAEVAQAHLEQEVRERERLEQELRVARSIQQASLPKAVPTLEGWHIAPYYQPAREVGGDFYDFHLLPEGRVGLVVGDATGKGVPAALVMSTTCGMLRLAAQSHASPAEMLQGVNEVLFPNIPTNMFVTCFYAILEPNSGRLVYANAGHDLPYLHRNGEAEELRARGMPLGLMPSMRYEEKETIVHSGQAALLYSDGLVEAHDPEGDMFGFPRLRTLIAERAEEERPLGEVLLEELYSFVGKGWEQEDDITLLTLKRSAYIS
jgi:serine phosphatase RsbU (regulator of sigma subunit)/predicted ester cyclase